MKTKVEKHYSGKLSKKGFWNFVKIIDNESDHQEVYSLGVALQNMEEYVVKRINDVLEKEFKE